MKDKILYSCWTKATTEESGHFRRSAHWITARRAKLYVTENELRCRNWRIPYEQIRDAVLFSFRGSLFLPGYILKIDTGAAAYQFGLNGWGRFWKGELPFPVRRERGKLRSSPFSIAIRAVALAYFAYWAWRRFF